MGGVALSLFQEKKVPFLSSPPALWPELWKFVMQGKLEKIDYFLAERIAKMSPSSLSVPSACFLLFLIAATRSGHLCVKIEEESISPPVNACILEEEPALFLEARLKEGAASLPPQLVEEADLEDPSCPLCKQGSAFYLQSSYLFENRFVHHLHRLMQNKKKTSLQLPSLSDTLQKEQKKAIEFAFQHSLTLITGGPGTGKTYTAAHLMKAFLESDANIKSIALAAPTGKAAANLESALRKTAGMNHGKITCGTLHSLLQIRRSSDLFEDPQPIVADLIIVDECSMIDARLFCALFSAIGKNTKVVLMGDSHQLSAVESGSYFADLVHASQNGFAIPCALLQRSMRSEETEILQLADAIKRGDIQTAIEKISSGPQKAVKRLQLGMDSLSVEGFYSKLWHYCKDFFPKPSSQQVQPEELLRQLDRFRLLSPLRKGPFGVDAINQMFAHNFWNEMPYGQWSAAPILITRTNYDLGLCNGDTGVLLRFCFSKKAERHFDEQDVAIFWDKEGSSFREIPALLLPSFEYAYCLSVHKSQGSEYNQVLLLAPQGTELFGREVLYTAITRAKERLEIEADDKALLGALQKVSRKTSGLQDKLKRNV